MKLLEGSDMQIKFHVIEIEDWAISDVDLTVYDKIILTIRYTTWIVELEWTIDSEEESNSYVIFDIFSESTKWKSWKVSCDIRWVKDAGKNRFNLMTITGDILPSIKVPNGV